MLKINVITLFPNMFAGPFDESIIKRAQETGKVTIEFHDLRKYGLGERKTVDDRPYGGGVGMILRLEPLMEAIKTITAQNSPLKTRSVLLSASGQKYTQQKAQEYAQSENLILICGRYEGVDERIMEFIDDEISIGDYVLTGGEIPSMVIIDSVTRLIPGVLEKEEATKLESFSNPTILEEPKYTRPEVYENHTVPEVLLSGDHKKITEWKEREAKKKTERNRPDLLR
jgi:tRNA (guanine37-N1)-methyltransferase